MQSIITLILFLTFGVHLFGQDISFNIRVSQLIEAATDSTEETDRNTHYFLFSKNGELLASQNMQRSTHLINRKWFENSRIEKHLYKKSGQKKQSKGFYIDTLGNEFNKDLIQYQYKKGKLIGEIISIGVDSIVSFKDIEYDDDGKIKKVETRKTRYDFELDQIRFDQLDTIVSQYRWYDDSKLHIIKSDGESFKILIYPDSASISKYWDEELKFKLVLHYDTLGRLISASNQDHGMMYYEEWYYRLNLRV